MISIAMKPQMNRRQPGEAEIERPDLRITELAEPVRKPGVAAARPRAGVDGDPHVRCAADLYAREDVLIFSHVVSPHWLQIGSFSHQPHHSGQPRVQNGPLMTMHTALQKPADSARKSPNRWIPSEPIE